MAYLIGIDLGTTSIKSILLDSSSGQIVATSSRPTPVEHPQPDWSEHAPEALWQAVAACLREIATRCSRIARCSHIAGLAISSMAEPGTPVDARGRPLASAIAWFDRRSEPQAAWVDQQISLQQVYELTGQRVSPSFAVTKLLWLRENRPEIHRQMHTWLPLPAYLLQRLCNRAAVDPTLAARTLLFDRRRLAWSPDLLSAFKIEAEQLPEVLPSGAFVGELSPEAAAMTGLPAGTPCFLGGHDHLCAAFAAGAANAGSVVDSTGTAQAVVMLLPTLLSDATLATSGYACSPYVLPGLSAMKGGLKAAGSSLEWLVRQFSPPGQPLSYAEFERSAWSGVGRRAGPLWLPHLLGSGTPEGDRLSRAALVGTKIEHDHGDLFRGLLESLAFWLRHNLEEMNRLSGLAPQSVTLTGGVTRLELLSQLKADVLAHPVTIPQIPQTAAVGAALLAGLGASCFTDTIEANASLSYPSNQFEPDPQRAAWYNTLYQEVYRPLYASLAGTNDILAKLDRP